MFTWRLASAGGLLTDEWSVLTNVLQCLTVADKWLVPSSVYGCRHCTWTSTGWTQKVTPPPTTFVDISALSANFCMKFYVTVKQSNIHFITKFRWIYRKMTKLCCFSQDNPLSQCTSIMQNWLNANGFIEKTWVALKLSRFEPTGLSHLGYYAGKVS